MVCVKEGAAYIHPVMDGTKGIGSYRRVLISPDAAEAILTAARKLNPDGEYIFMRDGKLLTQAPFASRLRRVCRWAGFWYKQGSGAWNLYFYVTNLQGDITKIIDDNGSSVGTYSYDAWGKVTSVSGTVAQANPLRYRGYYYDAETGFYQLRSRYYDPEIGRFVNADSYASTG